MAYIRRANLLAFWAREAKTISGNLSGVNSFLKTGTKLGLTLLESIGPWPIHFDHGMATAIVILDKTLEPGIHEATIKFSTARKLRSVQSNMRGASAKGSIDAHVLRLDKRRGIMSTNNPTETEWFTRFIKGLENRMGQRVKQDAAISIDVMLELMERYETADYEKYADNTAQQRVTVEAASFAICSFCANLRGYEVPKVMLTYLSKFHSMNGVVTCAHILDYPWQAGLS